MQGTIREGKGSQGTLLVCRKRKKKDFRGRKMDLKCIRRLLHELLLTLAGLELAAALPASEVSVVGKLWGVGPDCALVCHLHTHTHRQNEKCILYHINVGPSKVKYDRYIHILFTVWKANHYTVIFPISFKEII